MNFVFKFIILAFSFGFLLAPKAQENCGYFFKTPVQRAQDAANKELKKTSSVQYELKEQLNTKGSKDYKFVEVYPFEFLKPATNLDLAQNPILNNSRNNGFPAYDQIRINHFLPAFRETSKSALQLIEEVKAEKNPTFENVILKLESALAVKDKVLEVFSIYDSSFNTPEVREVEKVLTQESTQLSNLISTDLDLFKQIKTVYLSMQNNSQFSDEQKLLASSYYKGFARSGAELPKEQQEVLNSINLQLSELSSQFSNNITDYTATYYVHLKSEKELEGLPEKLKELAAKNAEDLKLEGFVLYADYGTYPVVIEKSENPQLRKDIYFLRNRAGHAQNEFNNEKILKKIAELRQTRAEILGYKNHAEYILEERMAKNLRSVDEFIDNLISSLKPKAQDENQNLLNYIKEKTGKSEIPVWDRAYWMDKYTTEQVSFDKEIFKDYLQYENVRDGFFKLVHNLYGITFVPRQDLPKLSPDMETYEIRSENGELLSYLQLDIYSRKVKNSGAWMNQPISSYVKDGVRQPAFVTINMNINKPTEGSPTLFTLDEGETFFHEFGHALHGALTRAQYLSHSGTNVKWDFVELPSQVMENFFYDADVMRSFAKHHETGEPIPNSYLEKLTAIKQMFSANLMINQLSTAKLDLRWHDGTASKMSGTLSEIDNSIMNAYRVAPHTEDITRSAWFGHIFSGGYSAGYYSYWWAQVLDADAYKIMKTEGPDASRRFLKYVLEVGGSMDPAEAYRAFAQRPPDITALLDREGVNTLPNPEAPQPVSKITPELLKFMESNSQVNGFIYFVGDYKNLAKELVKKGFDLKEDQANRWSFYGLTREQISELAQQQNIQTISHVINFPNKIPKYFKTIRN